MVNLKELFHNYYNIVPADSQELLEIAFRLRHQIFYQETGQFGNPNDFPDGCERDQYDHRAAISLLQHKPSKHYIGTVRLVLADPKDPHQPFPIEVYTRDNPGLLTTDSIMPSRLQIAEISRFSLIHNFQRHLGIEWPSEDRRKGIPTLTYRQDKKTMPYAILGLCIASIRMSAEHNITHWYTMMEPTLTKLLGNFGFCFDPIGPAIECLGRIRRPYLTPIDKSLAGVYRNYKDIWELMTDNETLSAKPSIPFPAPLYY